MCDSVSITLYSVEKIFKCISAYFQGIFANLWNIPILNILFIMNKIEIRLDYKKICPNCD